SLDAHPATAVFAQADALAESCKITREDIIFIGYRANQIGQGPHLRRAGYQPLVEPAAILDGAQQASLSQRFQVARELVLQLLEAVHQFAQTYLFAGVYEQTHDANAGAVGQGLEDFFGFDGDEMHSCIIVQACRTAEPSAPRTTSAGQAAG